MNIHNPLSCFIIIYHFWTLKSTFTGIQVSCLVFIKYQSYTLPIIEIGRSIATHAITIISSTILPKPIIYSFMENNTTTMSINMPASNIIPNRSWNNFIIGSLCHSISYVAAQCSNHQKRINKKFHHLIKINNTFHDYKIINDRK